MPDEATNAPVPGDFTADESPLAEELDTHLAEEPGGDADAAPVDDTEDEVSGVDAVPDEANAAMDPVTENLADELAAAGTHGDTAATDETPVSDEPAADAGRPAPGAAPGVDETPASQPAERPRRRRSEIGRAHV